MRNQFLALPKVMCLFQIIRLVLESLVDPLSNTTIPVTSTVYPRFHRGLMHHSAKQNVFDIVFTLKKQRKYQEAKILNMRQKINTFIIKTATYNAKG